MGGTVQAMALVTLRVLDGADRGRVFRNLPTPVTIGREEGNTVQLNDERVSRFHAKIQEDQDKLVLTDLDSTNGTKVNGEEISVHILRHGDLITLGRSVLVFGTKEEIAQRLARLRQKELSGSPTAPGGDKLLKFDTSSFELNVDQLDEAADFYAALQQLDPPSLPSRLSPAQAGQLAELLSYLHTRIRRLIASVQMEPDEERVTLDQTRWQALLDLQWRLANYLRQIGDPEGRPGED